MEIIKVHGERRKQRILILILAPMFFATGAFGIYLDFSRETDFWAPLAGISSVIVFGCIGLYCERKILRRFKCPKCGTHIPHYQLDENSFVSYQCQRCNVKYDTGFSIDHGT